MKLCIDAGHNDSGPDTGAQGNGLREQDITFAIAHALSEKLREVGVEVIETRPTKETILGDSLNASLQKRCQTSNAAGADWFISIHCNAAADASARGTEVYIYFSGAASRPLAQKIQDNIVKSLKTADRGVKTAGFAVLRGTDAKAILIETAFISNPSDAVLLRDRQGDFVEAIFKGVCESLGIEQKSGNQYSYDDTVNNMVLDGIIKNDANLWANIANWEAFLSGKSTPKPEYIRMVFDRYHEKAGA